jgi:hypothetical protein
LPEEFREELQLRKTVAARNKIVNLYMWIFL